MLTDQEITDAVERLDDGVELVIIRSSARWRARRGLYLTVPVEKAEALFDALEDYYHLRTGVRPPRRVLTPEPIPCPDHPSDQGRDVIGSGWEPLRELADATNRSPSGLKQAGRRGDITMEVREGSAADGRSMDLLHVRVDEDLADYLSSFGLTGSLKTPEGDRLDIESFLPSITLTEPEYTHEKLSQLLGCEPTTVSKRLCKHDLPVNRVTYGRHIYPTCPALAEVIEQEWTVDVSIDLPDEE